MGYVMKIPEILSDLIILTGICVLVYGISLLTIPGAFITAGIMLVLFGAITGMGRRMNDHS